MTGITLKPIQTHGGGTVTADVYESRPSRVNLFFDFWPNSWKLALTQIFRGDVAGMIRVMNGSAHVYTFESGMSLRVTRAREGEFAPQDTMEWGWGQSFMAVKAPPGTVSTLMTGFQIWLCVLEEWDKQRESNGR